ncbi:MAG: DegT/DnrJ/EryC1/StrS aminotransferase family protein [Actinomycetota bacterium]|nr:DegT/DnrJ/EryC1/StrS aminotransferase family protein [Actinomycetota bacterium]
MDFSGLAAQRRRLGDAVDRAVSRVLDHGRFVLGPEVERLETELARRCGVPHAVTCASGTDALLLALLAWGAGAGDGVLVPAFTFAATAEVVVLAGAVPVFVDVCEDTFDLDAGRLTDAARFARGSGLRPVGVIAVDLFGHPADYAAIADVARAEGLWVLADAAQSMGASWQGRPVGSLADATATSFFPAKPLGCYGDGGALFTADDALASTVRSLRAHGQGGHRYEHVRVGTNSRLDTIQAAVLLEKLAIFDDERAARHRVAARYGEALADVVTVPLVQPGVASAWAQYTVRAADRDGMAEELGGRGIPTAVHYPRPLHGQPAFAGFPVAPGGAPVAERLAGDVLSLPAHAYLDDEAQDVVVAAVRSACC